jgi:hypothetical protein
MLLDRGSRSLSLKQFDIGRHMHGLSAPEGVNPLLFAPAEKIGSRAAICPAKSSFHDSPEITLN